MALPNDIHRHSLSDDAARSGVTGHNVRYVLAAGLTGIVFAFSAIAIYFGYDAIQLRLNNALSRNPSEIVRLVAPYAALVGVGALAVALLFGVWSLIAGRDDNPSQFGMRLRVVSQFVIVCLIMIVMYLSSAPT